MKSEMARFYGWDNVTINSLKIRDFKSYYASMGHIKATESLDYLQLNTYHRMKEAQRDKIYKSLEKKASRNIGDRKTMTTTQAADFIKGKMNG